MNRQREAIPIMDYGQYRRARRLVHECCNYDGGNCLALDDGAECVCVQSISYSLLCHWFRAAVLPLDKALETARLQPGQVLPGLRRTNEANQGRPTQAKTTAKMSRFRH